MMTVRGEEGQKFSEDEILDNLVVLCFAGHDTTQSVMGILVAVLCRKEGAEHLKKLKQEITENFDVKGELDFDKLKTLPWLNAVINESLRYRSSVTMLFRKALEDLPLSDGTIIPKGERFAYHPAAHHFDEAYWGSDAHKYNPQRFLELKCGGDKLKQYYVPFGRGARICPGEQLARLELRVLVVRMVQGYTFEVKDLKDVGFPMHMIASKFKVLKL